jgi:hypothetical protein
MKYAVEMGSGYMMYIPSFIKIGSTVRKLMRGGGIYRHIDSRDCIRLRSFFQNKESRLIIMLMA